MFQRDGEPDRREDALMYMIPSYPSRMKSRIVYVLLTVVEYLARRWNIEVGLSYIPNPKQ